MIPDMTDAAESLLVELRGFLDETSGRWLEVETIGVLEAMEKLKHAVDAERERERLAR